MSSSELEEVPIVYVAAVSPRNRAGFGIFWDRDAPIKTSDGMTKNGGIFSERVDPNALVLMATLAGISEVLKKCAARKIREVEIRTCTTEMDWLNQKTAPPRQECQEMVDWIYANPVKCTIISTSLQRHPKLAISLQIAHFHSGSHSSSKTPISDEPYEKGVIGVSVWVVPPKKSVGAVGLFFGDGSTNQDPTNVAKTFSGPENAFLCNCEAVGEIFRIMLNLNILEIRIRTRSYFIRDIFSWLHDNTRIIGYSNCFLNHRAVLDRLMAIFVLFDKIDVEHSILPDENIQEAEKLALSAIPAELPFAILSDSSSISSPSDESLFELANSPTPPPPPTTPPPPPPPEIPKVFIDGAIFGVKRKGNRAAGAVYWEDQPQLNKTCAVPGEQSVNRGRLVAILEALQTAVALRIPRLVVYCPAIQLNINLTENLEKWIMKDWISNNGLSIPDSDIYRGIEQLARHFESVVYRNTPEGCSARETVGEMAQKTAVKFAVSKEV